MCSHPVALYSLSCLLWHCSVSRTNFFRAFSPCKGAFLRSKADTDKQPTKPVRLHQDVAELLEQLAPLFGQTVPNFASGLLRPVLENRVEEAAELLLQKRKK